MTTATTPARVTTGGRDRYFDVLRTACIVWVVFYHVFTNQAWLGFWPAMGILFALSASLMVRSLDRSTLKTLRSRLQRLLPVLWLLGLFAIPAMFLKGWPAGERPPLWRMIFWVFPIADPPGSAWAQSATEPLWYLRSLVWFILLSPILLILYRWYPKTMMLGSIGILVAIGTKKIGFDWTGGVASGVLVDGFTFLGCWFLGFAHHEGMLKKIPVGVVVPGGLALAGFGTWWVLTHQVSGGPGEPANYDFNNFDMAQGLYSLGIATVLLRFSPKFAWIGNYKFLDRMITIINGRAMVIYLWHNIAIELSYPIADRFNVWQYGDTAATVICLVIALVLTVVGVLAFGWIEDVAAGRAPQLLPKQLGKKTGPPPAAEAAAVAEAAPVSPAVVDPYPSPADPAASTVVFARIPGDAPDSRAPYDRRPGAAYSPAGADRRQYDDGQREQRYDDERGYNDRGYDERRYDERGYRDSQYDGRQREDRYYEERRYDDRRYSDDRARAEDRAYPDDRRYEQRPRDDRRSAGRPSDQRPVEGRPAAGRTVPDRSVPDQRRPPANSRQPRSSTAQPPDGSVPSFEPPPRR